MGKLPELLKGVKKNISLKNHTTFKIGGPAQYFFSARTKKDLIKAVLAAQKTKTPFFILGGGGNILAADKGFKGLVIKNEAKKFKIKKNKIIAESGAILSRVVVSAAKAGLSGIEKGSGIPGTVGGAVYGNAGWPKGDWAIGEAVESAALLMPGGKIKKVNKKWLRFDYRNSRLKKFKTGRPVVLEVVLKLKKDGAEDLIKERQEILKTRLRKIPLGFSAGSVFKNPPQKSAGYLIEKCGLKGKKIGRAKISEEHANFIINLGGAKAEDVKKLIKLAKEKVREKFKIKLKEEIIIL